MRLRPPSTPVFEEPSLNCLLQLPARVRVRDGVLEVSLVASIPCASVLQLFRLEGGEVIPVHLRAPSTNGVSRPSSAGPGGAAAHCRDAQARPRLPCAPQQRAVRPAARSSGASAGSLFAFHTHTDGATSFDLLKVASSFPVSRRLPRRSPHPASAARSRRRPRGPLAASACPRPRRGRPSPAGRPRRSAPPRTPAPPPSRCRPSPSPPPPPAASPRPSTRSSAPSACSGPPRATTAAPAAPAPTTPGRTRGPPPTSRCRRGGALAARGPTRAPAGRAIPT